MGGEMCASKTYKNQNDFTTGLASLTGYVHSLLIIWFARTTNQSINTGMMFHWKNGKKKPPPFAQSTWITKDLFTHRVTGIFIAAWLLMHFLVSWWYTQLQTLGLKLLSQHSRNGYILLEFLNPLYTIEVRPSLIPISFNGQKNWESLCDLERLTGVGLVAKLKPKINILPVIRWTSRTMLETNGPH